MANVSNELIEQNKDKLDLRPCINFVAGHMPAYFAAVQRLFELPAESQEFAEGILFEDLESIIQPQVTQEEARKILSVMPKTLVELSKLSSINYFGKIPVPKYDENGNFSGEAILVDYPDFPRAGDHPSRILVGRSDGIGIYPSPIPKSVSTNEEAVKAYQIHVFLHEFFHTTEYLRRDTEKRKAVLLESDGAQFTLQDFWNDFVQLYLKDDKKFVSNYAATYADDLNETTRTTKPRKFDSAIGEQICESFVGYVLGILPNASNCTDFKQGHPAEYKLLDKLCKAKVLRTD